MENNDDLEEYNYDESLHSAGHSRKGKSKKEAGQKQESADERTWPRSRREKCSGKHSKCRTEEEGSSSKATERKITNV